MMMEDLRLLTQYRPYFRISFCCSDWKSFLGIQFGSQQPVKDPHQKHTSKPLMGQTIVKKEKESKSSININVWHELSTTSALHQLSTRPTKRRPNHHHITIITNLISEASPTASSILGNITLLWKSRTSSMFQSICRTLHKNSLQIMLSKELTKNLHNVQRTQGIEYFDPFDTCSRKQKLQQVLSNFSLVLFGKGRETCNNFGKPNNLNKIQNKESQTEGQGKAMIRLGFDQNG